jgi:primary-amine oxidase
VTETIFEDEASAQREVAPHKARTWLVRNPSVTNRFGRPVAYKLQTGAGPRILAHPTSLIARKGGRWQQILS